MTIDLCRPPLLYFMSFFPLPHSLKTYYTKLCTYNATFICYKYKWYSIEYHRSTPYGVGSRKTRKPLSYLERQAKYPRGTETDILPKERMEKGVQRKLYVRNRNENWRLLCIATEVSNTTQKTLKKQDRNPRKVNKLLIEELLVKLQLK